MLDCSWPGWGLTQSGISAGAGLLGVLVGGWVTSHNQKKERQSAHYGRQLQEFYSPILGIWDEINAKVNSQELVHKAVQHGFEKLVNTVEVWKRTQADGLGADGAAELDFNPDDLKPLYEDLEAKFKRLQGLVEKT